MFYKTQGSQVLVQLPDCPAEGVAGAGENQKVVHKAGIAQVRLLRKMNVSRCQMKSGQQGAQCGCPGNALRGE